jgi:glycosyltransferase involved in cell wall biosynthesis
MHIVFISTNSGWGGSETLWFASAEKALKSGCRVSVFVYDYAAIVDPMHRLVKKGAQLFLHPVVKRPKNLLQRVYDKIPLLPKSTLSWWERSLPKDADFFCVNQGGALCALGAGNLCESILQTGKPYLCLGRNDVIDVPLNDINRARAKWFFEGALAYIGASGSTLQQVRMRLPTKLSNGVALHSPLRDYGNPIPAFPSEDVFEFACVGRLLVCHKGQHLLIEALAMEAWRARNFKLTFYGEGPDESYLRDLVSFHGLNDKIHFAGHIEDIRSIWCKTHIAIQPSLVEGAPQSLIEAMMCARPCVATSVSGIPEWVEDGKTGFLAESPSVGSLVQSLERAWQKRANWQEMGIQARLLCKSRKINDPVGILSGMFGLGCNEN